MATVPSRSGWSVFRWVFLWMVVPLAIGIGLSMLIKQPLVGVIHLNQEIVAGSAQDMITQIIYARENPQVKAVVLVLDSPGGTVADTEAVYLELAALREVKPVVSVVGSLAASGAYYLAVGTDYIIARPTSDVGNVGVIGYLPNSPIVLEDILSTGPYKMWGQPRDTFQRQMEMIKQGFYQAVVLGRGDKLKAPAEVVLRGEIWPGTEALRLGLIDALGSQSDAYRKAAELAHIAHYKASDMWVPSGLPDPNLPVGALNTSGTTEFAKPEMQPGLYLLYIPPTEGQP